MFVLASDFVTKTSFKVIAEAYLRLACLVLVRHSSVVLLVLGWLVHGSCCRLGTSHHSLAYSVSLLWFVALVLIRSLILILILRLETIILRKLTLILIHLLLWLLLLLLTCHMSSRWMEERTILSCASCWVLLEV